MKRYNGIMNKTWVIVVLLVVAFCIFAFRHSKAIAPAVEPGVVGSSVPTAQNASTTPTTQDAPTVPATSSGPSVSPAPDLPVAHTVNGTTTVSMRLREEARIMGLIVRPIDVVEDSRCPRDVDCVWAGRIQVAFAVSRPGISGSTVVVLENRKPFDIGGTSVRLTLGEVSPIPSMDREIEDNEYLFTVQGEAYVAE